MIILNEGGIKSEGKERSNQREDKEEGGLVMIKEGNERKIGYQRDNIFTYKAEFACLLDSWPCFAEAE